MKLYYLEYLFNRIIFKITDDKITGTKIVHGKPNVITCERNVNYPPTAEADGMGFCCETGA